MNGSEEAEDSAICIDDFGLAGMGLEIFITGAYLFILLFFL